MILIVPNSDLMCGQWPQQDYRNRQVTIFYSSLNLIQYARHVLQGAILSLHLAFLGFWKQGRSFSIIFIFPKKRSMPLLLGPLFIGFHIWPYTWVIMDRHRWSWVRLKTKPIPIFLEVFKISIKGCFDLFLRFERTYRPKAQGHFSGQS